MSETGPGGIIATVIAVVVAIALFSFAVVAVVRQTRENRELTSVPGPLDPPLSATRRSPPSPAAIPASSHSWFGAAFGWNIVVIVVGMIVAAIGLSLGLAAEPSDSAIRQTVAALWVLQGLVGLLIAAIGVLGASLIYFIGRAALQPPTS